MSHIEGTPLGPAQKTACNWGFRIPHNATALPPPSQACCLRAGCLSAQLRRLHPRGQLRFNLDVTEALLGCAGCSKPVHALQGLCNSLLADRLALSIIGTGAGMGAGRDLWDMLCRSKVLAERRAFEMCKQQSRWSLVTIQPSVVQGPPPGMPSSPHYWPVCHPLPSHLCRACAMSYK